MVFCVDGLTRAPRFYPFESLDKPRDLKDKGVPEVRAFPARGPELDEIDIRDVIEVVRLDAGRAESPRQLLRINSIERRDRVFLGAVALGVSRGVGRCVAGRLRDRRAIIGGARGGLCEGGAARKKTKVFRGLHERPAPPRMVEMLGRGLSRRVEQAARAQNERE